MKISFVELENYYPIKIAKWLENAFRWFESVYRSEKMRERSSARKCICKIPKNFRVEKSEEISQNLRFSIPLAGYSRVARRFPRPAPCKRACRSSGGECEPTHLLCKCLANLVSQPAEKPPRRVAFLLWCVSDLDATDRSGRFRCTLFFVKVWISLGDDGSCTWPLSSGAQRHACKRSLCSL